mmetsp:Transcript_4699/g.11689  ORF Transcript_4699/g.11689 Transcript_4699/m.11689 type:complete len:266 (-) Transcript_4699:1761-2558(-)
MPVHHLVGGHVAQRKVQLRESEHEDPRRVQQEERDQTQEQWLPHVQLVDPVQPANLRSHSDVVESVVQREESTHDRSTAQHDQPRYKVFMIMRTNTIVDPRTMMIKTTYTSITAGAVFGAHRPSLTTGSTEHTILETRAQQTIQVLVVHATTCRNVTWISAHCAHEEVDQSRRTGQKEHLQRSVLFHDGHDVVDEHEHVVDHTSTSPANRERTVQHAVRQRELLEGKARRGEQSAEDHQKGDERQKGQRSQDQSHKDDWPHPLEE